VCLAWRAGQEPINVRCVKVFLSYQEADGIESGFHVSSIEPELGENQIIFETFEGNFNQQATGVPKNEQ
jgi:hypothetical protein